MGITGFDEQSEPRSPTGVLVVDDHRIFAELLASALDAEPDLTCVGHELSAAGAIEATNRLKPDLVLMDLQLPDGDGITTTAELTATHPDLIVLILTAHATTAQMTRAAMSGASGFLAKNGSLDVILDALRTARRGSLILPPSLVATLRMNTPPPDEVEPESSLTARELEVLHGLGRGEEPRVIAKQLGVSLSTCRGYVSSILAKLKVHSQLEAVVVASKAGLIRLGE